MNTQEKLEEAKRMYKTANKEQRYVLESLFPELKESEDERMVKSMTRLVKAFYDCNFPTPEGFERKDLLAWLEKQGKLVEYYEDKLDRCACENFNKGYKAAIEHLKEKQGEQKSA